MLHEIGEKGAAFKSLPGFDGRQTLDAQIAELKAAGATRMSPRSSQGRDRTGHRCAKRWMPLAKAIS
jgi:hypothetical protein